MINPMLHLKCLTSTKNNIYLTAANYMKLVNHNDTPACQAAVMVPKLGCIHTIWVCKALSSFDVQRKWLGLSAVGAEVLAAPKKMARQVRK